MEEYVKKHGDGNPVYNLDKFQNPDFRITPAFGEKMANWRSFIEKCSNKEAREIMDKSEVILKTAKRRFYEAS